MFIRFHPAVDCTADPHWVTFSKKDRAEIADLILKVCESDVVWRIASVNLTLPGKDDPQYSSSYLSDAPWRKGDVKLTGAKAKKNKVEGLVQVLEKDGDLPPGLEGVRKALGIIKELKRGGEFYLSIGVFWDEFRDHNCSDYIEWPPGDMTQGGSSINIVNFENQDWYIPGTDSSDEDKAKYRRHLERLGAEVGCTIEPSEDAEL